MLAEKELQGRDKQGNYKTSITYMSCTGGLSKASTYRAPLPSSKQKASSGGATVPKPTTTQPSGSHKNHVFQKPAKSASSVASIGRTLAFSAAVAKDSVIFRRIAPVSARTLL